MTWTWRRERHLAKEYSLRDETLPQDSAQLKITGGKISNAKYDLKFANQHVRMIKSQWGRMDMRDQVLELEMGTVWCKEGLLNLIPSVIEWKDGRRPLYLSRPVMLGSGQYCLFLHDDRGRRLMRIEWGPDVAALPFAIRRLETGTMTPEDISDDDPNLFLLSGIAWIGALHWIWADRMFL